MSFEIIPAVGIFGKSFVNINFDIAAANQTGDRIRIKTLKPLEVISKLKDSKIYVIDFNAILKRKPSFKLIKKIAQLKTVFVNAGTTHISDLMDLIIAGSEYVVLNTSNIGLEYLEYCARLSSNLLLELEYNGKIELSAYRDILAIARKYGLRIILKMKYLNLSIVEQLAREQQLEIYVWCNTREDIEMLENCLGIAGLIINATAILK